MPGKPLPPQSTGIDSCVASALPPPSTLRHCSRLGLLHSFPLHSCETCMSTLVYVWTLDFVSLIYLFPDFVPFLFFLVFLAHVFIFLGEV